MEDVDTVDALMRLLENIPEGVRWHPRYLGSADEIDGVAEELGMTFPESYKRLVLAYDNAELIGPVDSIANFLVSDLIEINTDWRWTTDLPGMFFFSGDGGGRVYYIDLKNQLGRGHEAIYIVEMGDGTPEYSKLVAPSLYELYRRVIAGEELTPGRFLTYELDSIPKLSR